MRVDWPMAWTIGVGLVLAGVILGAASAVMRGSR